MDSSRVTVLTHIELKSSVIIVLLLHVEGELERLPFSREIYRGVGEIPDPSGIRGRDANDTFSRFVRSYIEGYLVRVTF